MIIFQFLKIMNNKNKLKNILINKNIQNKIVEKNPTKIKFNIVNKIQSTIKIKTNKKKLFKQ